MAHHKLTVIGRLVSDVKITDFQNGGRVAKFGLPIDFTRRKKNPETGEWEGDSFIINVDAFNKETYKLADLVAQYLHKGSLVYVEGRLKNNEYTDKNGVKIARPVLVADIVEFLDPRSEGATMDGGGQQAAPMGSRSMATSSPRPAATPPRQQQRSSPPPSYSNNNYDDDDGGSMPGPAPGRSSSGGHNTNNNDDDIPF